KKVMEGIVVEHIAKANDEARHKCSPQQARRMSLRTGRNGSRRRLLCADYFVAGVFHATRGMVRILRVGRRILRGSRGLNRGMHGGGPEALPKFLTARRLARGSALTVRWRPDR